MNKVYKAGEMICRENDYENWMYEIQSGRVEVIKEYGKKEETKLAEVTSGFIGEMGLINGLPRTASVIAKEDTVVNVIDENGFAEYIAGDIEKFTELILCLSERLSKLNEEYQEACETIKEYLETEKKGNILLASMKKFAKIFGMR